MRISDWSSDVCSSDLAKAGCCQVGFDPLKIAARGLFVALDKTLAKLLVLHFQRPCLDHFGGRDDMGEEDFRVGGARNACGQRQHALCPAGTVKWHENSLVALVRRLSLDGDEQNGPGRVGRDFLGGAANPALAQLLPSAPSQQDQAIAPFADEATNLLCRLSFGELDRGIDRKSTRLHSSH